jgi:DNA-directed RNA polymerase subunit beta'
VRLKEWEKDEQGEFQPVIKRYDTTVGRAILSEILPKGLPFEHINKALKKKEISKLINVSFRRCGLRDTVMFADKLMHTGFASTRAGISICVDDMLVPGKKVELLGEARRKSRRSRAVPSGLVTQGERYNKVVDIWGRTGDKSPRR